MPEFKEPACGGAISRRFVRPAAGERQLAFVTGAGGDADVIDNVLINAVPQNTADIVTFGLPGYPAVITGTDIAWTVPFSWNAAALAPTFTMPYGATAAPFADTLRDFTRPQNYTVTAEDHSTQVYTVTVSLAPVETSIAWILNGGGAWDTTSRNWLGQVSNSPTYFANGAGTHVVFNKTAGGTIAIASGMSPASTTVSGSGNYTFTGGPIAGGALIVSGPGQLSLQTTPTTFSSIVLNGGSLWLRGDVYGVGPCNVGNVTINSGATLQGERENLVGGTLIMNGVRYLENNGFGGSWTGPVYLAADSFFGQNGWCQQQSINGPVSGPGGFTFSTQYGATLILTTANSYAGPTIVTGGPAGSPHPPLATLGA